MSPVSSPRSISGRPLSDQASSDSFSILSVIHQDLGEAKLELQGLGETVRLLVREYEVLQMKSARTTEMGTPPGWGGRGGGPPAE